MNVKETIQEMKEKSFKVIRLSDGRYGIIFQEGKDAKIYAHFLKNAGLHPTKIHHTIYGYAFKFDDVSTIQRTWPHTMLPPDYEPSANGPIYKKWSLLKYIGYDSEGGLVHLYYHKPIGKRGTHIQTVEVPYPPDDANWEGDGIPVMTSIKPTGRIMGDEQLPFFKFVSYHWLLLIESGNWLCRVTQGMCPVVGDDIGIFIGDSLRASKTTYPSY